MPVQSHHQTTDILQVQMSQDPPPEVPQTPKNQGMGSEGEAWTILSYLLSGLLVWTGIGALLDHLLGTHFLLPVGMFVGAFSAVYLVWIKYGRAPKDPG